MVRRVGGGALWRTAVAHAPSAIETLLVQGVCGGIGQIRVSAC
jgi:hypothetical protein